MKVSRVGIIAGVVFSFYGIVAEAGPIYVYRESDGTVRFSSAPPKNGGPAKVFSANKAKFSRYSGRGYSTNRTIRSNRIVSLGGGKLYKDRFNGIISRAARQHRVGEDLIKAVIHVESAFNPYAISSKGALGLMQLLPENVRRLGLSDAFSPHENIDGGARWLAMLLRRFKGDLRLALAAYNAGIGAVQKYGGVPPYRETQDYVVRVLAMKQRYHKSGV